MSNKAGMSSGIEVARISVKVSPDTTHFRGELERQLQALEKSFKDKPLDIDADTSKAEKSVKKAVKDMSGKKVKIDLVAANPKLNWYRPAEADAKSKALTAAIQKNFDKLNLNWDKKMRDFKLAPTLGSITKAYDKDVANLKKNVLEMDRLTESSKKAGDAIDRAFKNADRVDLEFDNKKGSIALAALKDYANGFRDISFEAQKARTETQRLNKLFGGSGKPVAGKGSLGAGGGGGGGKGGKGVGIFGFGDGGGFNPSKLLPSFGSGINPAGYAAILAGFVLVAAPLIGLLTTAILTIPGLISAIATPFMAISLGLDGIKKAAAGSGLFKLDKKGEIDGLGAVFDPIKAQVSLAFEQGLAPSFKAIADAIQPLLGSLPQVATGLTDMFKGVVDAVTSPEGIALFDQTIQNIGKAMSASAPGIKDFTTGMMGLATSFTAQLPALSGWFNRTGDSFVKWVKEMTTVPDPAGHHGPNGKSPLDQAFEGLGGTLTTIGDWAVNMAKAGLKFVSDPAKMDGFLATLDKIAQAITKLIDLGNRLGPVYDLVDRLLPGGDQLPNVPGKQPDASSLPKVPEPPKKTDAPEVPATDSDIFGDLAALGPKVSKWFTDSISQWMDKGGYFQRVGGVDIPKDISTDKLKELLNTETTRLKGEITELEQSVSARTELGQGSSDIVKQYMAELEIARAELAELMALKGSHPALVSFESPLPVSEGGTGTFVDQLIAGLGKVPPAAKTAKDALQTVKDTGILTPAALGQLSANANGTAPVPTPAAPPPPVAPTAPAEIPAPDTSQFQAGVDQIPVATAQAMGEASAAAAQGVSGIADGLNGGTQVILTVVGAWPGIIQASLSSLYATGNYAGVMLGKGMVDGMLSMMGAVTGAGKALGLAAKAGAEGALDINSPSKVFELIGNQTAKGLSIGMENGFKPVLDQAKDLAGKISSAFSDGSNPTRFLEGFTEDETSRMGKVLSYQGKVLGRQVKDLDKQFKATGDQRLKDQAEALRTQIDDLATQRDDLALAQEYGELTNPKKGKSGNVFLDAINELMTIPNGFMSATADQAMQDLNISGDGALQSLAGWGMDFASKGVTNVFNTSNVDDTLALHFNQTNRQSQGVIGR